MKFGITQTLVVIISGLVFLVIILAFSANQMSAAELSREPEMISYTEPVLDGQVATFAAGCFWCTEAVFQETPGILDAVSGYAGGTEANPTYEDVYTQNTTHREALQISYDPEIISYEEILDIFWRSIDPTDSGGQFVDRGFSYTTAIFYHNEEQRLAAEASLSELEQLPEFISGIATEVLPYSTFYLAEAYHQDFYLHSAERYENYKNASGREEYKQLVWEQIQLSE